MPTALRCNARLSGATVRHTVTLSVSTIKVRASYPFLLRDCTDPELVRGKATPQVLDALRGGSPTAAKNLYMALDRVWPPLRFLFDYRNIDRWWRS